VGARLPASQGRRSGQRSLLVWPGKQARLPRTTRCRMAQYRESVVGTNRLPLKRSLTSLLRRFPRLWGISHVLPISREECSRGLDRLRSESIEQHENDGEECSQPMELPEIQKSSWTRRLAVVSPTPPSPSASSFLAPSAASSAVRACISHTSTYNDSRSKDTRITST